jgi:hypothetical protein
MHDRDAFHIQRSATPDKSVSQLATERISGPVLLLNRDYVEV